MADRNPLSAHGAPEPTEDTRTSLRELRPDASAGAHTHLSFSPTSYEPRSLPAKAEPDEAGWRKNLKHDLPASLVVFLVALPLCLGIAVASGAPPLSGLVAGAVGGIVVGALSGAPLAVSGPAAGLTTIVLAAIDSLGFEGLLLAGAIAGVLQAALGAARAGIFAYYIPSSVIKGMLAAIGIILILKQLPHAFGDDLDFEGDMTLLAEGVHGPREAFWYVMNHFNPAATLISALGVGLLILWGRVPALSKLKVLPAPLAVVATGMAINAAFMAFAPELALRGEHLVSIPSGGLGELWTQLSRPDFSRIAEQAIWSTAITLAAVASIETLLSIEAVDKLDPYKRTTPTNRELVAQGAGNLASSLLGGLPLTAVIVRGSANVQAGARTKLSTIAHGVWLVLAVVLLASWMNLIPLAALAAVLLHVGYKLASWSLFRHMLYQRLETLAPFAATVIGILLTDLLKGVGIGVAVGLFFILRDNLATPFFIHAREDTAENEREHIRIQLSENVSFLNKASVNRVLQELPRGAIVEIDGSGSTYIHGDVLEIIHEFHGIASTRGITVLLRDIPNARGGGPGH